MNMLVLPWVVMLLPLFILAILLLREVLLFFRISPNHPERKISLFNSAILLLFLLTGIYGMHFLKLRDEQFREEFPLYPSARYAPEREFFNERSDRVYVTNDDVDTIVSFYTEAAEHMGYLITLDNSSEKSGRLMIEKGSLVVFVTVTKERNVTVIHYSKSGRVEKKEIPSR